VKVGRPRVRRVAEDQDTDPGPLFYRPPPRDDRPTRSASRHHPRAAEGRATSCSRIRQTTCRACARVRGSSNYTNPSMAMDVPGNLSPHPHRGTPPRNEVGRPPATRWGQGPMELDSPALRAFQFEGGSVLPARGSTHRPGSSTARGHDGAAASTVLERGIEGQSRPACGVVAGVRPC